MTCRCYAATWWRCSGWCAATARTVANMARCRGHGNRNTRGAHGSTVGGETTVHISDRARLAYSPSRCESSDIDVWPLAVHLLAFVLNLCMCMDVHGHTWLVRGFLILGAYSLKFREISRPTHEAVMFYVLQVENPMGRCCGCSVLTQHTLFPHTSGVCYPVTKRR